MVAAFEIVGMILDVVRLAAILKQDFAPNVMQSTPFVVASRPPQFMFGVYHLKVHLATDFIDKDRF
jgi:hypothetical protein